MRSINQITLCGNLGRDVELKNTQSNFRIAHLSVATTKKIKEELKTQWHKVVCFNEQASCVEHARKGDKVLIVGEIEYQKYNDKDGNERTSTVIVASHATVIPRVQREELSAHDAITQTTNFYNAAQNDNSVERRHLKKETDLVDELPF